ncbi:hypothetical protein CALCODRAFT_520032 [Calocera cornea HHB12733]|uniref:Uncharacterized protein n=1 Tax=Calocera cornea HHB12733 TaxID=1353952 RepID=A0A165DTS5_9BASI|nr:hypothetical protein CALCODRAFT_520032 [Calocera cornea HHB12733]
MPLQRQRTSPCTTQRALPDICFLLLAQLSWQCEDLQKAMSSNVAVAGPSRERKFGTIYGSRFNRVGTSRPKPRTGTTLQAEGLTKLHTRIWGTVSHLSQTAQANDDLAGFPSLATTASQRVAQSLHAHFVEEEILRGTALNPTTSLSIPSSDDGVVPTDDDLIWRVADDYANAGLETSHLSRRVAFFHAIEMVVDVVPSDAGFFPWLLILESEVELRYVARYVLCRIFERLASAVIESGFDKADDTAITSIFTGIRELAPSAGGMLCHDARELMFSAMAKCLKTGGDWLRYAGLGSFWLISQSLDYGTRTRCLHNLAMGFESADPARYPVCLIRTTEIVYDILLRHFVDDESASHKDQPPWLALLCRVAVLLARTAWRLPSNHRRSFATSILALCTYCGYLAEKTDVERDAELMTTITSLAKVYELECEHFFPAKQTDACELYLESIKSWGYNIRRKPYGDCARRTDEHDYQYLQDRRVLNARPACLPPAPKALLNQHPTSNRLWTRKMSEADLDMDVDGRPRKRPKHTSYPIRELSPDDLDLFQVACNSSEKTGAFIRASKYADTTPLPSSDDLNLFGLPTPSPPVRRRTYTGSRSFKQRMLDAQRVGC